MLHYSWTSEAILKGSRIFVRQIRAWKDLKGKRGKFYVTDRYLYIQAARHP